MIGYILIRLAFFCSSSFLLLVFQLCFRFFLVMILSRVLLRNAIDDIKSLGGCLNIS